MSKFERPIYKNKKESRFKSIFKRKDKKVLKSNSGLATASSRKTKKGIFSAFKKDSSYKPQSISAKYSNVAQNRKKAILRDRLKDFKLVLPIRNLLVIFSIVMLGAVLLIVRNSAFNIKEIQIIAPKEALETIKSAVEEYKGQNIYLINEQEIFGKIKEKVPEIERIYLYKQLPNTVEIEALQGDPVIIFSNLNNVSLLDVNAREIGVFSGFEKINLTEFEQTLLKDEQNLDSDEIKEKYIEGKTDKEKLTIDWTKVPLEEKTAIYNNLKKSAEDRVVEYFQSIRDLHSKSVYNSLPLIESYYIDSMDSNDVNLSIALIDGIQARGIPLNRNFLSTKFTLDLYSQDNKLIRLSLRRPLESQIKEMDTIIYYGLFGSAKIIDLRSDTYSITR